ncbi:class I SAM-dependent methyltransferase [Methylocucumis oryzae]|uniref:class I SAM-dependent methyltransferase n=1 Tax=Methylocucumis oryzae TaxID=1632867 RepID=UPI0012FF299B|nr:class I SAM-dependent methyltransferase [Methylocucumis oryzae]
MIDHKQKSNFPISVCKQCGLVQQTHIPSEETLSLYYSHNYRMDYKNTYTPKLKHIRRAGLAAFERIEFLMTSPINIKDDCKLVDIGAGGGEFVYLSKRNGFDAIGIEPNHGYSEFAKREYGVEIITSMLDDLTESSADIVTIFHVFEHMANPLAVMKKIADVLKEGGLLFVEVPNLLQDDASPHNRFFKAHLYYYSKYTLIACASKYFDVIKVHDNGNLRVLFKKKALATKTISKPSDEHVELIINSFVDKGWLNYLFKGKGIFKPFIIIKRLAIEFKLRNVTPKELLDSIG